MIAWLKRRLSWLGVPEKSDAPHDPDVLPNGLYLVPPHVKLTGYEPVSFYLTMRVGDADRVVLRGATA